MKRLFVVASVALLIGACSPSPSASTSNQAARPAVIPSGAATAPRATAPDAIAFAAPAAAAHGSIDSAQRKKIHKSNVCPKASKRAARCHAQILTDESGKALTYTAPNAVLSYAGGMGPGEFHTAYRLPYNALVQQTIAIVNWGDDPSVKHDLDVYNAAFGLPYFPTCTTTGWAICFQKVNQFGSTQKLPIADPGTALETSMDVQTAHQTCLNCKILLVEARIDLNDPNGPAQADLAAAENMAAQLGATEISNSWGAPDSDLTPAEWNTLPRSAYDHPRIAITFSSGDGGYGNGTLFPADLNTVVAVGGTSLYLNADYSYSFEMAWSGAGSGCNANALARSFQTSAISWPSAGCGTQRGFADVAADADPFSGAWVYDSTPIPGLFPGGWVVQGGTSLSAPLIAGVYALAGNAWTVSYPAQLAYQHAGSLHDIDSGSNDVYGGAGCGYIAVCVAGQGYDGPTGLGTPNGLSGF